MKLTQEQQLFQKIVQEAWENVEFKRKLVLAPLEAIKELTGKELDIPVGKTLVVRDQTEESTVYINIPVKINFDDVQLTEEQLEVIAGGGEDNGHNGFTWEVFVAYITGQFKLF